MKRADLSAALHKAEDRALVAIASLRLLPTFLATGIGFIRLYQHASAARRLKVAAAHCLADAVRHEPSGFDGDAKSALQLDAADTLLAGAKQVNGLQPRLQLDMAGLEDGAHLHGEGLTAGIALVEADPGGFAAHLADAIRTLAMEAYWSVWPEFALYERICGFFIMKVRDAENGNGHRNFLWPNSTLIAWVCQV